MSKQEELTSSDERGAALAAAAGALRAWVQAQRTGESPASDFKSTTQVPAPPAGPAPALPGPSHGGVGAAVPSPPAAPPARVFQSTSILALDAAESAVGAAEAYESPWQVWIARAGRAYALLKRWLAPLKGPALRLYPYAAKALVVLALVGALVAGLVGGWRWAWGRYGPAVSEAWATFVAPTGTLVLESVPPDSQVYLNGAVVGTTPMTTEVSTGRHVVEFRRGENIRTLEVEIAADESALARLDWTAARTGTLRVESTPTGATVVIDGRERGVTPLTLNDLTVGSHEVVLRGEAGSVRRTVTIRLDSPTEVSEALYPGWIHVSTPIEVEIMQGGRTLPIDDRNQVLLPPGAHQLQFQNRRLGYLETRQIQVRPGEITRVLIAPSPSTLTVSATLPADVLIDGEHAGYTPLTNFPIRLGTREIVVRATTGEERRFTLTVSATPVQLNVDFSAP